MTLDLAADSAIFVADFGESVRFRVNTETAARTITANVNREPVEEDTDSPSAGAQRPTMHVMVRNDGTLGVTPDEIDEDKSQIEVASKIGDAARWRNVLRVLRQNTGCVLLEVRS